MEDRGAVLGAGQTGQDPRWSGAAAGKRWAGSAREESGLAAGGVLLEREKKTKKTDLRAGATGGEMVAGKERWRRGGESVKLGKNQGGERSKCETGKDVGCRTRDGAGEMRVLRGSVIPDRDGVGGGGGSRGEVWDDALGGPGGGGRGRRTCPISAPLPDLMPALPFSSPARCRLPPSHCRWLLLSTVAHCSVSPCCREQAGDTQGAPGCQGILPALPCGPPPAVGDRTGAEALQPLIAQVRNRQESGEAEASVLSLHPRRRLAGSRSGEPPERGLRLGQRK